MGWSLNCKGRYGNAFHAYLNLSGKLQAMDKTQAIWIKDPLAILADGAARGIVVRDGRIVELVPKGGQPTTTARFFEAGDHVVLPGLINTHHHFYQTLTRALPAALDRELFPWLQALYPVWARLTPESLNLAVTVAMSELLLSGCTTTIDHHYVFPAGLEDAVDIEVAVARRLGIRVLLTRGSMNRSQRDGGLPPDSVVQDEDTILADSEPWWQSITSAARTPWCKSHWRRARRFQSRPR
jgi:8-oxoguanine deaminase